MRIIHPAEYALLQRASDLKAQLEGIYDPEDRAPIKVQLKAVRAEHEALRAQHLPAKVTALREELAALEALPDELRANHGKRLTEIEKEIGWLEEEAARLDIAVPAAS